MITIAKSKYEDYVRPRLKEVEAWKRDGLTDEQIALNLGVAYSTFRDYKDKHPALLAVLKKGKEIADIEIENALYKRALGYEYFEEVTEIKVVNGVETKRIKKVKKHMVGDVVAQMYWLNNRKPKQWRAKRDEYIEQDANITINISGAKDGD